MENFEQNDPIVLMYGQLDGRSSVLMEGEFVSHVDSDQACVRLKDEHADRIVPLSALRKTDEVMGFGYTGRVNETAVIDQTRR